MLYIKRSDGSFCTFDGLTQDQVIQMLAAQGLSAQFLDEATYNASIPQR